MLRNSWYNVFLELFIRCGNWNGNEADIYCVSLFNLMKPDGRYASLGRFRVPVDAQHFEALEWQWQENVSCQ